MGIICSQQFSFILGLLDIFALLFLILGHQVVDCLVILSLIHFIMPNYHFGMPYILLYVFLFVLRHSSQQVNIDYKEKVSPFFYIMEQLNDFYLQ